MSGPWSINWLDLRNAIIHALIPGLAIVGLAAIGVLQQGNYGAYTAAVVSACTFAASLLKRVGQDNSTT